MAVAFGRWQPDRFALGQNVAGDAKGVLPSPDGYVPWPQAVPASSALAAACEGAISARTSSNSLVAFAGSTARLYKYTSATTWTNVTRSSGGDYGVPSDVLWSFAQYGTQLIAADINDVLQVIDVNSGTNFAPLGGSPPQASIVRTVGDFVMLGNLSSNPTRIQWSGRNNSAFWSPGTQDCDYQDFPAGGQVTGIAPFGQGNGLIFQEGAIRSFIATNDRSIFNFNLIEDNRGLISQDSMVTLMGTAFGLSGQGFFATDGSGPAKPIGADVVDKWFQGQVNQNRYSAVRAAIDPIRPRVYWLFPTSGNTSTTLDMCICYDITNNAWTYSPVSGTVLFTGATAGYTTDNIDALLSSLGYTLETVPFSFDSAFLLGGAPFISIFDASNKLNFFSGQPMAAVLETADFQPIPSRRAFVRGCRPIVDTTPATIAIGSKEAVQGTVTFGAAASQNAQGVTPLRSSGRWFRAHMEIPAGATWTHATGVTFDEDGDTPLVIPAGNR